MSRSSDARPFVLLDRDGTILVEKHHLGDPALVELIPGAPEAIATLHSSGLGVVVVTNQSGIGRGLYRESDMHACNLRMQELLLEGNADATLDAIYFCPHLPDAGCGCRKPGTGMARQASAEHGIALSQSFVIGDTCADVLLGHHVGARSILVETGHGSAEVLRRVCSPSHVAGDLWAAARWICSSPSDSVE